MADDVNEIASKFKRLSPAKLKSFVKTLLEADDDTYGDKADTTKNIPTNGPGSDVSRVAMAMARANRFKNEWKDSWDRQIDERSKDMVMDALYFADNASINAKGIINAVEATGRQNEPRIKARLDEFREVYEQNKGAANVLADLERRRALEGLSRILGG